jgi:hypothetical protein
MATLDVAERGRIAVAVRDAYEAGQLNGPEIIRKCRLGLPRHRFLINRPTKRESSRRALVDRLRPVRGFVGRDP